MLRYNNLHVCHLNVENSACKLWRTSWSIYSTYLVCKYLYIQEPNKTFLYVNNFVEYCLHLIVLSFTDKVSFFRKLFDIWCNNALVHTCKFRVMDLKWIWNFFIFKFRLYQLPEKGYFRVNNVQNTNEYLKFQYIVIKVQ